MKKFKFRLEKVLQYRHVVKEEKLRELHSAFRALHEAEEAVMVREEAYLLNKIEENAILPIEQILVRASYSERLKREIANLKLQILDLENEVERARAAYIEANQEAQVLEKLKEKKREHYHLMIAKAEEAFLDELTTQKGNTTQIQKG